MVDDESSEEQTKVSAPIATAKKKTQKPRRRRSSAPILKRLFPKSSIEECRQVPDIIKQFNAGNPWSPKEISKAGGLGVGDRFYYLTAGSRDYGYTSGTRDAEKIGLSDLGRSLAYPKSAEEEANAIYQGFLNVTLFKNVFEYYQGQNLPDIQYLKNTLKTEFGVPESLQDEFYSLYQKNLAYLRTKRVNISVAPLSTEIASSTIVLGESDNSTAPVAFVAMPFSEKTNAFQKGYFDEVLKHLITPAAVKAAFTAKTAKKAGSEVIQATIVNDLDDADLVIADLTEHNPNVLFELGIRIAFNKPVCLIRAKGTNAIFDIDHMLRVYDYNPCLWPSTLEIDIPALTEHILETWKSRGKERSYLSILRENK